MRIGFRVFALLCIISMVSSQLFYESPEKCATFELVPMEGFRADLYEGAWFMHQLYDFGDSKQYDCYLLIATPYPNGSLNVTEILLKPGDSRDDFLRLRFEGVLTCIDGVGLCTYSSLANPEYNGEYTILKTDYETYTVEGWCQDVDGGGSVQQLFVRTRLPLVTSLTQSHINDVITATKFDKSPIRTLNLLSCPSQLIGSKGLLAGLLKLVAGLVGIVVGLLGVVGRLLGGLLG